MITEKKITSLTFTNIPVSSDRVLYTPSSFAREQLLTLQEVGNLTAISPHVSSRANLSSYLFFHVDKGSGKLVYSGNEYILQSQDNVFIDCRIPYSHSTITPDLWSLSWIHFTSPNMVGIYDKYRSRGGRVAFQSDNDYTSLLRLIYNTAKSDSYVRDMELNSQISQLLVLLMKDSWNPENNENGIKYGKIAEIRAYIDEHYTQHLTLDDLSNVFFMNRTYLAECWKKSQGITIVDYIINKRITKAKELLRFTDKNMEEISADIGLNGASYFSRVFKKTEGCSPSEWKKAWKG